MRRDLPHPLTLIKARLGLNLRQVMSPWAKAAGLKQQSPLKRAANWLIYVVRIIVFSPKGASLLQPDALASGIGRDANRPTASRLAAILLALFALCMASTACWSNDTLFIPPTETPTPTPIPPTPNVVGKFKVGENVTIIGQGLAAVYLTEAPEPETRANRVASASCYPNSTTQIIAVEQVKDVTYYQITCTGVSGWVPEAKLKGP